MGDKQVKAKLCPLLGLSREFLQPNLVTPGQYYRINFCNNVDQQHYHRSCRTISLYRLLGVAIENFYLPNCFKSKCGLRLREPLTVHHNYAYMNKTSLSHPAPAQHFHVAPKIWVPHDQPVSGSSP